MSGQRPDLNGPCLAVRSLDSVVAIKGSVVKKVVQ